MSNISSTRCEQSDNNVDIVCCNNLQHVSMKPSREPNRPVVRRTGAAWQHPAPLPAARVVSWWRKHVDLFSSMATSSMWTAGVPHPTACRGNFVVQRRCLQRQFYFKVRGNHTRWSQGVRDRETSCSRWRMMDLMHHFDFTAKWWCDFWKSIVKICTVKIHIYIHSCVKLI